MLFRDFPSVNDVDASWQALPTGCRANLHAIDVVDGGVGGLGGLHKDAVDGFCAFELHFVDIAILAVDGEADNLLPLLKGCAEVALHRLVGVPIVIAGLRYIDLGQTGDAACAALQTDGETGAGDA